MGSGVTRRGCILEGLCQLCLKGWGFGQGNGASGPERMKAGDHAQHGQVWVSVTSILPSPASPFPGILIHFHGFFSQMMLKPTFSALSSPKPQTHPTAPRTPLRDASQACQASHITLPKGSTSCSHSLRTQSCRSPSCQEPESQRSAFSLPTQRESRSSSYWLSNHQHTSFSLVTLSQTRPLSLKGCSWPFSSRPCQTF